MALPAGARRTVLANTRGLAKGKRAFRHWPQMAHGFLEPLFDGLRRLGLVRMHMRTMTHITIFCNAFFGFWRTDQRTDRERQQPSVAQVELEGLLLRLTHALRVRQAYPSILNIWQSYASHATALPEAYLANEGHTGGSVAKLCFPIGKIILQGTSCSLITLFISMQPFHASTAGLNRKLALSANWKDKVAVSANWPRHESNREGLCFPCSSSVERCTIIANTQLWGGRSSDHCHLMLPLLPSYGSNLNRL